MTVVQLSARLEAWALTEAVAGWTLPYKVSVSLSLASRDLVLGTGKLLQGKQLNRYFVHASNHPALGRMDTQEDSPNFKA